MIPRILIVSDVSDARSKGLAARLERRGAVVATVPLAAIAFDTGSPSGLSIPGFDGALPDAVLVRSIAAGSFEAVTRRLGVLHAFGKLSIPVWNSAQAIERCVDKSMTTFLLKNAGLPTPPTFAVEGFAMAEAVARRELPFTPLVLKPLFGAQGRGIRLIETLSDLPAEDEVDGVYYLQHYVPRPGPPFRDFRVFVCAGEVLAMMSRRGDDWITNVNRGAVPELVSGQLSRMAKPNWRRWQGPPPPLCQRISPASISCRRPTASCWCWRSTACPPGPGFNRSSRSTSPMRLPTPC